MRNEGNAVRKTLSDLKAGQEVTFKQGNRRGRATKAFIVKPGARSVIVERAWTGAKVTLKPEDVLSVSENVRGPKAQEEKSPERRKRQPKA